MKKKILLLTTFVFAVVTILYSVGVKEVKAADDSCKTYTNYYLFLSGTYDYRLDEEFEEKGDPLTLGTTSSIYSLELPEGAEIIDKGNVEFGNSNNLSTITLENFYDKWVNTPEGENYSTDNGITTYFRSSVWFQNGSASTEGVAVPDNYDAFSDAVLGDYGNPEITVSIDDDEGTAQLTVLRTIYQDEVAALELEDNEVVYAPGVYYIQYQVCEEPEEPVQPKKLTVTFNFGTNNNCSEGTDIRNPETTEYTEGESVRYTIPEIDGYEFSNVGTFSPTTFRPNVNNTNLSFEVPGKNASICLVYVKNPQTGAGWIYFAWIIGIAALAYGGWYFMKYYKNQNNEI